MIKRLKSFHKLFFIVLFSFLFSGAIGSGNSPDLPDKIAPELEKIEALPRRTKPAELNIEVTKIKSESLDNIYFIPSEKALYIDFSNYKSTKDLRDIDINNYELFISDSIEATSEVTSGSKKTRNYKNRELARSKFEYKITEVNGFKKLRIDISKEELPSKIYIGVLDKNTKSIIKIFKGDIKILENNAAIEEREVTVYYHNGFSDYGKVIYFDSNGTPLNSRWVGTIPEPHSDISVKKHNFESGFINGISTAEIGSITELYDIGSGSSEKREIRREKNSQDWKEIRIPSGQVALTFVPSGEFNLQIHYSNKESYRFKIVHKDLNGNIKKIHYLNINKGHSMDVDLKEYFEYNTPSDNDILIKESLIKNEFNSDGTAKYPNKIYSFYTPKNISLALKKPLAGVKLFPVIYLGNEKNNGGYHVQNLKQPYRVNLNQSTTTGIVNLMPDLTDFSYEHTVAAGSAPEKPSSETFYTAVGAGVVNPVTNRINAKIGFYILGKNLAEILKNLENETNEIKTIPLTYDENYTYSLSPGDFENYGNNCYLPSRKSKVDDILENSLPKILVEKLPKKNIPTYLDRRVSINQIVIEDSETLNEDNIYTFAKIENWQNLETEITSEDKTVFPVIALGAKAPMNSEKGWGWNTLMPPHGKEKEMVATKYSSILGELDMNVYLDEIETNPGSDAVILRGPLNNYNVLGSFGINENYNRHEYIKAEIKAKPINLESAIGLMEKIRRYGAREIVFKPQGLEQINLILGEKNESGYFIPASDSLETIEKKVYSYNYPEIKIRKNLISETINVFISNDFDLNQPINLNENAILAKGVNIKAAENKRMKSLLYESFYLFGYNREGIGWISLDENGNSEEVKKEFYTNDKTGKIYLSCQYVNHYPVFKILSLDNISGKTIKIPVSHYDPSSPIKIIRRDYYMNLNFDSEIKEPDFRVTSDIKDILIIKDSSGEIKVEIPEIWINVSQNLKDESIFPVIGVDAFEGWKFSTDVPLNPISITPIGILELETDNSKEDVIVPINIKETPHQGKEKFFLYKRGEMSKKNIAVGGYTPLEAGDGSENKVKVNFEIDFSKENLEKIVKYAEEKNKLKSERVLIPWQNSDLNKFSIVKGVQSSNSPRFSSSGEHIAKKIDFPKVYVIINDGIKRNSVNLNFLNPVPKTDGSTVGTFDIESNGLKLPNAMLSSLNHPASLSITNLTAEWQGYSIIGEQHKIEILLNNKLIKEVTTTPGGHLNETVLLTSVSGSTKGNVYILKKGVASEISLGVKQWNLAAGEDIVTLRHKNAFGRIVIEDSYNIKLNKFNPEVYLSKLSSTLLNNVKVVDGKKRLEIKAKVNEKYVNLGSLKLQNYCKEITKTLWDAKGIRIEVPEVTLESDGIDGKVRFSGDKTYLSNPDEISELKYSLTSETTPIENNKYSFENTKISIKLTTGYDGEKRDVEYTIADAIDITWTSLQDEDINFPYMSSTSTLQNLEISDTTTINSGEEIDFNFLGMLALQQTRGESGTSNIFPTIALVNSLDEKDWKRVDGKQPDSNRKELSLEYSLPDRTSIFVSPQLTKYKVDNASEDNLKNIHPYIQSTSNGKILGVGAFSIEENGLTTSGKERVSSGLKYTIKTDDVKKMIEYSRTIPGDKIEIPLMSKTKKIAYIHSRNSPRPSSLNETLFYLPNNSKSVAATKKIKYINFPSIIIKKDKIIKSGEIGFRSDYTNNTIIKFNLDDSVEIPETVIPLVEKGIMKNLNYEHTIRLNLENGSKHLIKTDKFGKGVLANILIQKNSSSAYLTLNYTDNGTEMSLHSIKGTDFHNIVVEHIDPSGDIRRTYRLKINTFKNEINVENGVSEFSISSRYNPGQSSPIIILPDHKIKYPNEVLDFKIVSGVTPRAPHPNEDIFINGTNLKLLDNDKITLERGTILKIIKDKENNLIITPLYWKNSNNFDQMKLVYKDSENTNSVTCEYDIIFKIPDFFVASIGVLDFGKIYQIGNPEDRIKKTNIELYYNDSTINPTYSLDISTANPEPNTLYLDDEIPSKLKVINLNLKEDKIKKEILNNGQGQKVILPLEGTIPKESIKTAKPGKYEKTIQILIHIK
ncbi:MAG: hypothetical protein ACRC8M_02105 [Cetobacterium sp.]|uniref:hypothetical protein n=1 Tax=Cetobacterium sp. TaxID=2071632 RepID=UPI003F2FBF1B